MPKVTTAHNLSEAIDIVKEDQEPILDVHSLESQLIVTSCSHAQLGDSGATELARVLGKNANLRSLILGGNGIGPEGAKALGAALRVNLGLQELYTPNPCTHPHAMHNELVRPSIGRAVGDIRPSARHLHNNALGYEGLENLARELVNPDPLISAMWASQLSP
eukprot:2216306-Rhodomonas_salina.2